MLSTLPLSQDLVLVGGGHTHALFLRMWGMNPLPGVRVTLISPEPVAAYSGMLPGHIAGHYPLEALEIDLVQLARFAGARFVVGHASGLDRANQRVRVPGHPDIFYDQISLDIGIHTEMHDLPGFARYGIAAKPLDTFAAAWSEWCSGLRSVGDPAEICVIGAGLAGSELALAMQHRVSQLGVATNIALIDSGEALSGVGAGTRRKLLDALALQEVALHTSVVPIEISADAVTLADGRRLPSQFTLGVAGARAHGWLSTLGLETVGGHVVVDPQLRSVSDPQIFACGDCAHLGFAPRPKAGVFAVRAAPVLFHNLRAALSGGRMKAFRPQRDYLKLVSMGGKDAIADRSGLTLSGQWLWRWKDRIDRRFMERLQHLPAMPPPKLPRPRAEGMLEVVGDKPLCGGCGAKLAGGRLKEALAQLPRPARDDVLTLPGDDAAILAVGGERQVITTDHLRAFTEDPAMLARICAVHSLGDIWAMGARPQAALASITLPRMREEMQASTLREILAAASEVFRGEGADIVGGHTSIGAELTIGFTLTGLAAASPITLAGARTGDVLLLTKPIGSGTILAGEMQRKARGKDVVSALRSMARPQGAAAEILQCAHAMTDVTGFGLAGHLMGLCEASGTGALLTLEEIPVYSGSVELASQGVRSTIWAANRTVAARMVLPETPRAELLFDPQTAGGLLAAVPPDRAETVLRELRQAGFPEAARIGEIVPGPPLISVL